MSTPRDTTPNTIARKGWDKDLADGLANEDRLENCLRYGKIEVKRDYSASKSGNIYVEYWNNRKKSGLRVTEAKYWAFTLGNVGEEYDLILPTELLRKIVKYFVVAGKATIGGDREGTAGILVPLDAFNPLVATKKYHNFDPDKWDPWDGRLPTKGDVVAIIQELKRTRLEEFEEVTTVVEVKATKKTAKERKAGRTK
jgi:hypothetical protein